MARALTLLNRTSVNAEVPGAPVGAGVTEEESGGVVAAGEAAGDVDSVAGSVRRTSSSWAERRLEKQTQPQAMQVIMVERKKFFIVAKNGGFLSHGAAYRANQKSQIRALRKL